MLDKSTGYTQLAEKMSKKAEKMMMVSGVLGTVTFYVGFLRRDLTPALLMLGGATLLFSLMYGHFSKKSEEYEGVAEHYKAEQERYSRLQRMQNGESFIQPKETVKKTQKKESFVGNVVRFPGKR